MQDFVNVRFATQEAAACSLLAGQCLASIRACLYLDLASSTAAEDRAYAALKASQVFVDGFPVWTPIPHSELAFCASAYPKVGVGPAGGPKGNDGPPPCSLGAQHVCRTCTPGPLAISNSGPPRRDALPLSI